jgi:hypothetical protein
VNPAEALQSNPAEIVWLSIAIGVLGIALLIAAWRGRQK